MRWIVIVCCGAGVRVAAMWVVCGGCRWRTVGVGWWNVRVVVKMVLGRYGCRRVVEKEAGEVWIYYI